MLGQLFTTVSNAVKHHIGEKLFAENIFGDMYKFTVQASRDFLEKMEYSADMYSLDAFIYYYQVEVSKCDSDIEALDTQIDELEALLNTAQIRNHDLHDKMEAFTSIEQIAAGQERVRSWTKAQLQANYLEMKINAEANKTIRDDLSRQLSLLQNRLDLMSSRHQMETARYERRIQFLEDRIKFCSTSGYMPPYKFDDDSYLEEVVNIFDDISSNHEFLQPTSIFIAKDWLHKAMLTSPSGYRTYAVGLACPLACSLGTQFCEESSGCLTTWIGMSIEANKAVA